MKLPVSVIFLSELIAARHPSDEQEEGPHAAEETGQRLFAKQLLKTIMGDSKFVMFFTGFNQFTEIGFSSFLVFIRNSCYSLVRRPIPERRPVAGLVARFYFLVLFATFAPLFILGTGLGMRTSAGMFPKAPLAIVIILALLAVLNDQILGVAIRQKLYAWNLICKEVGIQDKAMYKATYTWFLPWIGHEPFDYYLPD